MVVEYTAFEAYQTHKMSRKKPGKNQVKPGKYQVKTM
jgi:hypothetical protein